MKFSDRIGITQPQLALHIDSMPDQLRTTLWNYFFEICQVNDASNWGRLVRLTARDFRKYPLDRIPHQPWDLRDWLKDYFYELTWAEAYNFLEFFVKNFYEVTHPNLSSYVDVHGRSRASKEVQASINNLLEREHSGFRFVSGFLAPIVDQVEIDEVNETLRTLTGHGLDGARVHIQTALRLFAQRPSPDYRNSIKESISAIESICRLIGENSSGLEGAIRALDRKVPIHGALRIGFEKMYAYTCDANGIRHAILEESVIDLTDAKYMIVACSAFANYLSAKANAAGLMR